LYVVSAFRRLKPDTTDYTELETALGRGYDVSPDGTRFLMIKDAAASTGTAPQLVVVLNFFEELKRLVPTQ